MKELPVTKCIDILKIFYAHKNENLWVNKIVKKVNETTGSRDSPAIKKTIKMLEQGKILESKKINKQKELKILTALGTEIIDLFYSINSINDTFSSIQNQIKEYEKLLKKDKQVRRSLLLNSGWTKNELDFFEKYNNTLNSVIELYIKNICNLLMYRFFTIISDFQVNEISKLILTRILSDELITQFNIIAKAKSITIVEGNAEDQEFESTESWIFHNSHSVHEGLSSSFLDQLENIYLYNFLPNNKIIQKNMKNLLKAMIYITDDDKMQIKNIIKNNDKILFTDQHNIIETRKTLYENKITPFPDQQSTNKKIDKENILDLVNLYDEILKNQKNNSKQKERYYKF